MGDLFAHHVVQALVEHGSPLQKQKIVEVMAPYVLEDAQHRSSSYVIESAILHAGTAAQQVLADRILRGGVENVETLGRSQCGNRVLKAFCSPNCASSTDFLQALTYCSQSLMSSKQGRRLLSDLRLVPKAA